MTKRQTKFGRPDVNDAAEVDRLVLKTMAVGSPKAQISRRRTRSPWCQRVGDNAFHLVQRLSWRGFACRKNCSGRRVACGLMGVQSARLPLQKENQQFSG